GLPRRTIVPAETLPMHARLSSWFGVIALLLGPAALWTWSQMSAAGPPRTPRRADVEQPNSSADSRPVWFSSRGTGRVSTESESPTEPADPGAIVDGIVPFAGKSAAMR